MFVKFASEGARDKAIATFNAQRLTNAGKSSFMNPDLPIGRRAPKSFLFGMKRLLVEWGEYQKNSLHVDTDALTLSVDALGQRSPRGSCPEGLCSRLLLEVGVDEYSLAAMG